MANKTYYSQPKKGAGKIIAATACVLALVTGVCAIGVGTSGFKDWSFSRWFPKNEVVQETPNTSESGGVTITEGESSGMVLAATAIPLASYEEYGVSALAENAFSLSVTYTPSDTTYKATTFTAAFKNPSSTWAKGKSVSDYVTVTATGDTTATLTVLQAFSEQVIVTASCNRNTAIKATTTVDYVGTFNLQLYDFDTWDMDGNNQCVSISRTNPYINGTLCPDSTQGAFTVIYDTAWIAQKVKSAGLNFTVADSVTYEYSCTSDDYDSDLHDPDIAQILKKACNKQSLVYGSAEYKTWWSNISSAILDGKTPEEMNADTFTIFDNVKVITHRIYNGINYGDVTVYDGECVGQGWEVFEVSATSLSYSSSSIIAG